MPGFYALGAEVVGAAVGPAPEPASYAEAIEGGDGHYLVEISAYIGGETRAGGIAGIGEIALGDFPPDSGNDTGQILLTYADRHWVGEPGDTQKPNALYEGRVDTPLILSRAMPLLPEDERRSRRQFGAVEISNGDGGLDPIVQSYAVDGRRARILFGPYMGDYGDFRVVADVLGDGWEGDSGAIRLNLRDRTYSLDTKLQETLYTGAGGAEGTTDLQGKPKPLMFGRCRNVTAVLIDPTNLIYQLHDGSMHALDAVYDRGAALTVTGTDVASYAALVSQSVSAGFVATSLAAGMFKLGALPDGLVTADARGGDDPVYIDTLDTICLRILLDIHGTDPLFVDTASFAGAAAIAGEMGIYLSPADTPSAADVLSRLLQATAGWWGPGRDGRIRAGRLTDPAARSPNAWLDVHDILDLAPEPAPVPRWRQRVGYRPNWTVQRGEDLAGSVTAARRQFLTEPYRVVSAADAVTRVRHLQALDPDPLPGLYDAEADADTLADFLQALHGPDRQVFNLTVKRVGYRLDLGKIVRVTWPRYGLGDGKNFAAIGLDEKADAGGDFVALRVWG